MIKYSSGYKYQLRDDLCVCTCISLVNPIHTQLVSLLRSGLLIVRKYFSWDGASGLAIDTKSNIRASCVHDALYYLMRIGELDIKWRGEADKLLRDLMLEDGALPMRAAYYEWAVRTFAKNSATPAGDRKILTAP